MVFEVSGNADIEKTTKKIIFYWDLNWGFRICLTILTTTDR
jgi:hypothetical protein